MIRNLATALAVLLVACGLAAGSAWWALFHGGPQDVAVGAWRMNSLAGSAQAGLYTRARGAVTGLFALNASETIYFAAAQDDAGRPLRAACRYTLTGRSLTARWWSITAYADDFFLIPNAAQRFSYNMGNLAFAPDGSFTLTTGPDPQPGNWLPTGRQGGRQGGLHLLLRLYNPAPAVLALPQATPLPSITPAGDCP